MTFPILLVLFLGLPLLELKLLFLLADHASPAAAVVLVVLTGVAGAHLARRQGRMVLRALREDLNGGRMPTDHLLSGMLVLVGGTLLVTPGLLTDAVGLLLMVPGNRRILIPPLKRWLAKRFELRVRTAFGPDTPFAPPKEVDAREVEDAPTDSETSP